MYVKSCQKKKNSTPNTLKMQKLWHVSAQLPQVEYQTFHEKQVEAQALKQWIDNPNPLDRERRVAEFVFGSKKLGWQLIAGKDKEVFGVPPAFSLLCMSMDDPLKKK